jgi:hypothetical protein
MLKHWRAIIGLLFFVKPVWDGIKWILDWFGRFDLIASHLHDFGMQAVLDFISNPPPWTVWPTIGLGCLLIWWDVKRKEVAELEPNRKILIAFYIGCAAVAVAIWGTALALYFPSPAALAAPTPKPTETPKVAPVPPLQRQLQSTAGKVLLSCLVPPGDKKKREESKINFRKFAKLYGDTFGVSMGLTDIEDGYRIEMLPVTAEGRVKMKDLSRIVIRLQRIGENVLVTYLTEMPGFFGEILAAAPLDSNLETQIVQMIEKMLGPTANDKCKVL